MIRSQSSAYRVMRQILGLQYCNVRLKITRNPAVAEKANCTASEILGLVINFEGPGQGSV